MIGIAPIFKPMKKVNVYPLLDFWILHLDHVSNKDGNSVEPEEGSMTELLTQNGGTIGFHVLNLCNPIANRSYVPFVHKVFRRELSTLSISG